MIFQRKKKETPTTTAIMRAPVTCYLSGPFGQVDIARAVALHRDCAAHLVRLGYSVVSPILNSVPVWLETREDVDTPWWESLEEPLIEMADVFVVIITVPTFLSPGVQREIEIATRLDKLIRGIIPLSDNRFVIADLPGAEHVDTDSAE